MAPKRPIEEEEDSSSEEEISDTQNPPNPKSDSEEEEEDEESSSEEEERESLERERLPVKPSSPSTSDPSEPDDDVATDDVSGSDTASAFTVKPSKPSPNPEPAQPISAPKSILAPKSAEQKRPALIWNEDGEVAVLEGVLGFRAKKGLDPSSNWEAFYLFIKKTIPFDVTKSQVMEKIRRLRKKYVSNALKGDSFVFSKPHDSKLFELSKKVWGGDDNGVNNGKRKVSGVEREGDGEKSSKSVKRMKKEESLDVVLEEVKEIVVQNGISEEGLGVTGFWNRYPRLRKALDSENFGGVSGEVKRAREADLSRIGHSKAKELEDKWKLYQVKEAELKMMWLDIVREQTKLVIEELAKP